MAQEYERRFLLRAMPDLGTADSSLIVQGYLSTDPHRTVRIRLMGDQAFITVKGKRTAGLSREFEYAVPAEDAKEMLTLCGPENTLSKKRYFWPSPDGYIWEVDEFLDHHAGLVIAEVELPSPGADFQIASWMNGVEITQDNRFSNSNMIAVKSDVLKSMIEAALNPR